MAMTRRGALLAGSAGAVSAPWVFPGLQEEEAQGASQRAVQVEVQEGESLTEAIERAPSGSILRVGPETYEEQVVIGKPLTIRGSKKGTKIEHRGEGPALWVVEGGRVKVRDVVVQQPSTKDVCAALCEEGKMEMEGCELFSAGGSGACSRAGELLLKECRLIGSSRNGAVASERTTGKIEGCLIRKNGSNGVVIERQSSPEVRANTLANNGSYGLDVLSSSVSIRENTIFENGEGSIRFSDGADQSSLITSDNFIDPPFTLGTQTNGAKAS